MNDRDETGSPTPETSPTAPSRKRSSATRKRRRSSRPPLTTAQTVFFYVSKAFAVVGVLVICLGGFFTSARPRKDNVPLGISIMVVGLGLVAVSHGFGRLGARATGVPPDDA
jgi:hypothetical protein